MYSKLIILSSALVVTLSAQEEKQILDFKSLLNDKLSIGTSISNFNSESNQYSYSSSSGRKISQLTYEAKNVKLIGIEASYKVKNDVTINFNYKKNLSDGDGVFDDYDWNYDPLPDTWTHWSHHENTDVEDVNILDLSIFKSFTPYKNTILSFGLGYKSEKQSFKAYDGDYIYSTYPVLRGNIGSFSGLGISKEQEYSGLYLGTKAKYSYKDFDFDLGVKYSDRIDIDYNYTHHFRGFTTYTNFDKTNMLTFDIGASYNFLPNHKFRILYENTKYSFRKGDRTRVFDDGSADLELPNTSGVESKSSMITVTYKYYFNKKFY